MTKGKELLYIDDAGDPGKYGVSSTRYFVIAIVIFDDELEAEATSLEIKRLRRSLGWRPDYEFKFNKMNLDIRTKFLSAVRKCNFRIFACVVDKKRLPPSAHRTNLYDAIVRHAIESCAKYLTSFTVRLDGKSDKIHKRIAAAYFRKGLKYGNARLLSFRYANSQKDNLVQLADVVAGSINRSLQKDKTDHGKYLPIIKQKFIEVIEYPKKQNGSSPI